MNLSDREIAGLIFAPMAAPSVFMLQGGFGSVDPGTFFNSENILAAVYWTVVSLPIWVSITVAIGLPIYLFLKKLGAANLLSLTFFSALGCYSLARVIFGHDGAMLFGVCGLVSGALFWAIVTVGTKQDAPVT
jgi:hypothetical protein